MKHSPAASVQRYHPLLFIVHYTGIFSISRIVISPAVTREYHLVKWAESAAQDLRDTWTGNKKICNSTGSYQDWGC